MSAAAGPVGAMVVAGTLTLDTIERDGTVHAEVPGGSALYAAAAASLLLPVRIAGTVGADFPLDALAPLWARGVDRGSIDVVAGRTFRWHARYAPGGDTRETLARDPGVTEGRRPPVPVPLTNYAVLLGSTHPALQAHVRDACPGARLTGLDSMAHWWRDRPGDVRALLPRVDVLFVDEGELDLAMPGVRPGDGVEQLLRLGPARVVVKRGSRGAWMQRRDHAPLYCDAVALADVVDPTGAGDAFAGAMIAALACQPKLGDAHALRYATAVASFAVSTWGTQGLQEMTPSAVAHRMAGAALRET